MNTMGYLLDEPERETSVELAALSEKLDRIQTAVEALDRRREELEELVTDLLPAVNGMVLQVMDRLDTLERSGALALAQEAANALETAATHVDPDDVRALGDGAATGIRALRAMTAPEIATVAERSVNAIRKARTGKPLSMRKLWKAAHKPHVRRGLAAALDILRALGEGVTASEGQVQPVPHRPIRGKDPTAPPRPAPIRPAPTVAVAPPPAPAATVKLDGLSVKLDNDGFLMDPEDWTREVAQAFADVAGIGELTDTHWKIIEFCREDAAKTGAAPGLRRITTKLGVPPKELYTLFPKGPGILAARIAGLSKPKSCV